MSGRTCFDPVLFHYYDDEKTYMDVEHTFIVGDSILVAPVLDKLGADKKYQAYFPAGNWTDLDDWSVHHVKANSTDMMSLTAKETVNKFLMQGKIIPIQMDVNSTSKSLDTDFTLIANRDEQGHAQGKLFIDRGLSRSEIDNATYEHYEFILTNNTLQKLVINTDNNKTGPQNIAKIVITNAGALNETDFACWTSLSDRAVTMLPTPTYNKDKMYLEITGKDGAALDPFTLQAIHFGSSKNGDINLCSVNGQGYMFKNPESFNLSRPTANITLTSTVAGNPDLHMNISIKENGML